MSHPLKASTCLDSLLHLDSGRSMMLLSVLEWAAILICPGLRCFLACGTWNIQCWHWISPGQARILCHLSGPLYSPLRWVDGHPSSSTERHQLSFVCLSYTQESLHRGNTKCMSVERMKERMTFSGFQHRSVAYPGRRAGLGTRRVTPLLTGCVGFCQVINSLLRSLLICKEGQGLRSLLCYTF